MKALQKRKDLHKETLVKDLTFNSLRIKIIGYSQKMLICNEIDDEFNAALSLQNGISLDEIVEERVSMFRCCNLRCAQVLPEQHVKKITARKLIIRKDGTLQENSNPKVFCPREEGK